MALLGEGPCPFFVRNYTGSDCHRPAPSCLRWSSDIQGIRNALSSAVDAMHTIGNSTRAQLPKLARTDVFASQLSRVFIQEHSLMMQCRDLLSTLASMHVRYNSLQGQRIQLIN
ncbi:Protein SNOWY COTYLEDON 3 [Zea mays]|uniref:Protein SNOWY COTYLEDON 3 n=1 Tax=Zea mays TaxID=4577 RepID=A0A1D6FAF6_MAIZE|nr:Protein SNOWY COTYLEDON 3 [Zea mays]